MSAIKKWKISGVDKNLPYCKAGPIVLGKKLKSVFKLIDKFMEDDSVEVLHQLRIAVRRFRYVLEIFYDCYEKEFFLDVYNYAKNLQDLIGEGRDLDVMREKIEKLGIEIDREIPKRLFKKIDEDILKNRQIIKKELIKFKNNKKIDEFINKG